MDRSDRDMRLLFRPSRAAHATLHATASRLGLRTEGRSIQKIRLPSSDLHGTLFMRLPISSCGRVNIVAGSATLIGVPAVFVVRSIGVTAPIGPGVTTVT